MKYIISESQLKSMDYEVMSDVLYKILRVMYPNNYDEYVEGIDKTNILSEDGDLLFYYEWGRESFIINLDVINNIYRVTRFPLFSDKILLTDREDKFDEFLRVFAKRHYGLNVKSVYLGRW